MRLLLPSSMPLRRVPFETLTHGYFSFAGNLLSGSLPAFLDSNQVPDVSMGLINLQVCSCLEHIHASTALL